ncbi:protein NYNRIN [Trifolium repens]|nr:protein NYNRIN [Trifolium repens]
MGLSRANRNHLRRKGKEVLLEKDHMQVWTTQVHSVRQRHPIHQRIRHPVLRRERHSQHFCFGGASTGERTSRVGKHGNLKSHQEEVDKKGQKLDETVTRNPMGIPHHRTNFHRGNAFQNGVRH